MPPTHFLDKFQHIVALFGDHPAIVVDGQTQFTYRTLLNRSRLLAAEMDRRGIKSGSTVGIKLPKSGHLIAALLGVWMCRAAWVPIADDLPQQRIKFLIDDANVDLLIVDHNTDQRDVAQCAVLVVDDLAGQQSGRHSQPKPLWQTSDLAYVIYTSGTTGRPKGVEVSHCGLVAMLEQQIAAIGLNDKSRSLFLLSPSFDAAVSDIGTALLSGAGLYIETPLSHRGRLAVTQSQLHHVIQDRQISYIDIPPSLLTKLNPQQTPECLQTLLIGGEVCPPHVVRKWAERLRLINVYGPTEATVCTSLSICDPESWDEPSIGRPLQGVEYEIDTGETCDEGELLIGGDGVACGYRGRAKLTADRFFERAGVRWYRSGDHVRRNNAGDYIFLGRIDRQLKIRGHRIEPESIENALNEHELVEESFVAAVPRTDSLEQATAVLIAVVSLQRTITEIDSQGIVAKIRADLQRVVPGYALPQRFIFVDALPVTEFGKPDHAALTLIAAAGSLETEVNAELTPNGRTIEETLNEVFAQSLGHRAFSTNDNFMAIGGDSLKVIDACALAVRLGLSIHPNLFYSTGSIDAMARTVRKQQNQSTDTLSAVYLRDDIRQIVAECSSARVALNKVAGESRGDSILITGATGFLGCHLLQQLLTKARQSVFCLVRGENPTAAHQRLRKRCQQHAVELSPAQWQRVEVITGDITQPDFGMPREDYDNLARQTGHIIHSAAMVNSIQPYETLRATNVIGTHRLMQFANFAQARRFDYVSTLSVFVGTDCCQGVFYETDQLEQTQTVYGGYAQSKWAAEVLIRQSNGLAAKRRYFRLGLLTPAVSTGVYQANDLLPLTLRGLRKIGAVPTLHPQLRFDVTPVDMAAAIVSDLIFSQPGDPTRSTFHIAHHQGLAADQWIRCLRLVVPEIVELPLHAFARRLNAAAMAREPQLSIAELAACRSLCHRSNGQIGRRLPRALDLFQATGTRFDMTHTAQALRGHIPAVTLTDEYVVDMIATILNHRRAEPCF